MPCWLWWCWLLRRQCPETWEWAAAVGGIPSQADIWSQQLQKMSASNCRGHGDGLWEAVFPTLLLNVGHGILSHLLLLRIAGRKGGSELVNYCRSVGVAFLINGNLNHQDKENRNPPCSTGKSCLAWKWKGWKNIGEDFATQRYPPWRLTVLAA